MIGVCIWLYMHVCKHRHTHIHTHTHTHTHTHKINSDIKYILLYIQKKTSTETRGLHRQLTHRTFTDTNLGIKKDHIPIKTIFTIKTAT